MGHYLFYYTLYINSFIINYKHTSFMYNTRAEIHTILNYNCLLYIPISSAPSIVELFITGIVYKCVPLAAR